MDIFELGGQVRIARLHRRMSQRRLAAEAGVSVSWLARFEQEAGMEPSIHRVLRVLHALRLDLRLTTFNQGRPTLRDLEREAEDLERDEVFKLL